jgi:hypothetical protein
MAIVINGSGTVTGISVGGLPDGIVDAGTLATNSVDSAELIDGAVDNSHLADDAVDSDEIAAGAIDAAHLASGVVGDNTPSFSVRITETNEVSISNGAYTQMTYDTEEWDTDSAWASNTFTVPSGEDGKYLFTYTTCLGLLDDDESYHSHIRVNDGPNYSTWNVFRSSHDNEDAVMCSANIINLTAGQTVKAYIYHGHGSALYATQKNRFSGCKLSGV